MIEEFEIAARRRKQPELIRRQHATQATLDKFRGKAFDWARGVTCVHLLRFHLRAMGHRIAKVPPIRSLLAARRVLDARGWADVAAVLDAQPRLVRIAPAEMRAGDLAFRASDDGIGGVLVCVGPHKLFGWFANAETEGRAVVMDLSFDQMGAAWRV